MMLDGEGRRVIVRAMESTLLTPLLPVPAADAAPEHPRARLRAALLADPALAGRVSCDDAGLVTLTGPAGGAPPASAKERQRWEMHVRLRLAAELGESAAAAAVVQWSDLTMNPVPGQVVERTEPSTMP